LKILELEKDFDARNVDIQLQQRGANRDATNIFASRRYLLDARQRQRRAQRRRSLIRSQ
jgi:hypothetical protein